MMVTGRLLPSLISRTALRANRTTSPRTNLITNRPTVRRMGPGRALRTSHTPSRISRTGLRTNRRIVRRTARGTSRLISLRTDLRIIRPIRVDSV